MKEKKYSIIFVSEEMHVCPTCTLFAVHVSHIISLPSRDPVTQCLESPAKCTEFTLLMCPFRTFLGASRILGISDISPHFS